MKRSVNFSKPKQFALMAAMRNSTTLTWQGEPITPEVKARFDSDYALLMSHHCHNIAIALDVAIGSVTKKDAKNLGNILYAAYDAGWRTSAWMKFTSPDGEVRNAPTIMWYEAFCAIERAQELRSKA